MKKVKTIMRITSIIIAVIVGCSNLVFSTDSRAQNLNKIRITIRIDNESMADVLGKIENASGVPFSYEKNLLGKIPAPSQSFRKEALSTVLDRLLTKIGYDYELINHNVVVAPKFTGTASHPTLGSNDPSGRSRAGRVPSVQLPITNRGEPAHTETRRRQVVSGHVADEQGKPLGGVSVAVKGSNRTEVTNAEGNFSIAADVGEVLVFSFVGFQTQEITVSATTPLDVVLTADMQNLNEVVVVGYGTQKRVNLAGSVASITGDEITKTPVASVSNTLAGRLPGLITLQSTGLPGSDNATLKIRGFDGPLVLIDGSEGNINAMDPNEIESISVLKDASASIYGARAGNGVILITTKRGQTGKPTLTLNTSTTWQGITNMPRMASSGQLAEMRREGHIQGGQPEATAPYTLEEIQKFYEGGDPQYPNTDWYDLLIRTWSPQQQHNLSVRGGSEKIKYYGILGYLKQETFFKRSDAGFQRYNLRSNIDATITEGLTARMDLSTSISMREYTTRNLDDNIWGDFWNTQPMYPAEFPDKDKIPYAEGGGTGGAHITTDRELSGYSDRRSQDLRAVFELAYDFRPLPGLKAKALVDYKQNYSSTKNFSKPVPFYRYDFAADVYTHAGAFGSTANLSYNLPSGRQILSQGSLAYDRVFNEVHDLSVLALFESTDYYDDFVAAARSNFITPEIDQMLAGSTEGMTNNAGTVEMGRMSWVGRLNYSFDNRYIIEATLRADASAKFPPATRWGYFPGISLAWRLEQEAFLSDFSALDALKLRASYGASGNDNVGNFAYITGYDISGSATGGSYIWGSNRYPGILSKGLPNPLLTWEKLKIYNLGTDFSFWKGQFYGSLDAFYRERTGIPANRLVTLPSTFGASLPAENLNSTDTRGFELMLATRGGASDLRWDIRGNISWARSKWLDYEEPEYVDADQERINKKSGQWTDRTFGYLSDGLFTSQEEIDNLPYDQDLRDNATLRPGDVKYLDSNGDGVIDWKDQVEIGQGTVPTWIVGLNPTFQYKGFDLDFLLQGALGFHVVASINGNSEEFYHSRWTAETNNRNAIIPRLGGASSNGWLSDYRLMKGDYLRLKSVNIGYTFKKESFGALGIQSLRLFASGVNLFTFSALNKYALDPEMPSGRGSLYYPQQRNLSFGLTLIL